ncbi:MAG: MBL fold metallo-hydrolase [Tsuneonella sp.]
MKRWLAAAAAVIVGAAILVAAFGRTWIAEEVFDRAVAANVGVDRSQTLPDGLHAFLCGSGSPMPDETRAGPCIGVLAGRDAFVFDSGSGSTRKLLRMGFPIDHLQGVYLTHLHSDHFDGLGELLLQAWIGGSRAAPLPVPGPPGVEQVVGGLDAAYRIDSGYRIAHHGPRVARPAGYGGRGVPFAIPAGQDAVTVWDRDGVRIAAIRVNHAPVAPAYGYRIDYKGRSIALSGDTVYAPAFVRAASGVDVMFHEAMNKAMVARIGATLARRGRGNAAKVMHDIQGYHSTPEDAARAARGAHAGALVLYHLVPPLPSRLLDPLFLGRAAEIYSGRIEIGRDGLLVSLPANRGEARFDDVL